MSKSLIDEQQVKAIFKQSTLEFLQKRTDLCYDLLVEMLGDLALEQALQAEQLHKSTRLTQQYKNLERHE